VRVFWNTVNGVISVYSAMSGISEPLLQSDPQLSEGYNSFGVDPESSYSYMAPAVGNEVHPYIGTNEYFVNTNSDTVFGLWQGYVVGNSTIAAQWQSCSNRAQPDTCVNIAESNGGNRYWYNPRMADVGNGLRVILTLTTRGISKSATSAISPLVTETPVVGAG
jgi:hypothetical protein